jgi:hypothetical protein
LRLDFGGRDQFQLLVRTSQGAIDQTIEIGTQQTALSGHLRHRVAR